MRQLWRVADEERRTAEAVYVFAEEKDSGGRRRYIGTLSRPVHILPNSRYPARTHSHSLIAYRMFDSNDD